MGVPASQELRAVAQRLLDELRLYEFELGELLRDPQDERLYRRNTTRFDAIRVCASSLPTVYICWVEVLISRFELMEAFWRKAETKHTRGKLAPLADRHLATLATLRQLCVTAYGVPSTPPETDS